MSIVLGESTVMRSRASWHDDQQVNREQGERLAKDVLATRQRLLTELLTERFGPDVLRRRDLYKRLHILTDGQSLNWVTWKEPWQTRPEAIAVYTYPKTRVEARTVVCEWHWKALGNDRN